MDRKRLEDAARQVYILSAELSDIERRVDKLRRSLFDIYKEVDAVLNGESVHSKAPAPFTEYNLSLIHI